MAGPFAYKDSKPKTTINTTPQMISSSRSNTTPNSRAITPTRSKGSPPNLNKDKPLPPFPPVDSNRQSAYPKIDASSQPRAAPPLPPTPRTGPLKAQKILGATSPITPQLAPFSPNPGLPSSIKANKTLGLPSNGLPSSAKAPEMPPVARGLGISSTVAPVSQIQHSKKRSTEDKPSSKTPPGSSMAATNMPANNARDIFTRAQTNLKGLGPPNVSTSSSTTNLTNLSKTPANISNAAYTSSVSVSSARNTPVRNNSAPEIESSSQNRSRSGSRTTPRESSPRALQYAASPSSQYSDPLDMLSDIDDLEETMADTEAYWAAHSLTPDSTPASAADKAAIPVSPGLHRRSRSYNDLYHQQLPSLQQPLPLSTVPELDQAQDKGSSQLTRYKSSKQKSQSSVTNADRTELWQGLRDTAKYGSRADARTANKVIRRLTTTKQFPPIAAQLAQAPNAVPAIGDHRRSTSGEKKDRGSVNWNKTFSMVKNLTRKEVSVDEIIPMKGPGAISAFEQAKLTEQFRLTNARSKDRATLIAAAAPIAPLLQPTVYDGRSGSRDEVSTAQPPVQKPNMTSTSDAVSNTNMNSGDLALIPEEQSDGETVPGSQVAPSQRLPAPTMQPMQPNQAMLVVPAPVDHVDPDKRDTQYYKQKIAEANALFTKFIQNPDQHQMKLQSLIDDTRAERKTLIYTADPLPAWHLKKKEIEEAAAIAAGIDIKSPEWQSRELTIPTRMPPAPLIQAAPRPGDVVAVSLQQTQSVKRMVAIPPPLNLQAQQMRLTSPKQGPTRQFSRQRRRSSGKRGVQHRRASRSGPRSPRTPVRMGTQKKAPSADLLARLRADQSIYSQTVTQPIEEPSALDDTSPTVPVHLAVVSMSKGKNKKQDTTSKSSADIPILFAVSEKSNPAHDYNRLTTFGEYLDRDLGLQSPPEMPALPPNFSLQQAQTRQALEEHIVSPLDSILSPQRPAPLKFGKATPAAPRKVSDFKSGSAPIPVPWADKASSNLATPEESVVGTPNEERLNSFAIPGVEIPNYYTDDGTRKRSSVAVPGVEMPNYYATEWWEQSSDPGSVITSPGQRTVAEIRSWQFNLDDELAQLARLKSWDWEERNEATMLFTLDFNTSQD